MLPCCPSVARPPMAGMNNIGEAFSVDVFLNYFPALGPDVNADHTYERIAAAGARAEMYITPFDSAWLFGRRRGYALSLLAAHVLYLDDEQKKDAENGEPSAVGPVTTASVGGVSVSMQTPESSSESDLKWWLNKSPYGQEFLALLVSRGPFMAFIGSKTPVLPLR